MNTEYYIADQDNGAFTKAFDTYKKALKAYEDEIKEHLPFEIENIETMIEQGHHEDMSKENLKTIAEEKVRNFLYIVDQDNNIII